jgi:hypothetical protein
MSNLPDSNNHQFDDEHSSDDEDYDDIPLVNLKMKIVPPNAEGTKISSGCSDGHCSNRQGIVNETSKVMSGSRCILYGELINGPFILFQSTQSSHINTICIYNEYYVENKMHHINLSDLICTLIHADKSVVMVLMSTVIFDNVICDGGDISESLNAGASHALEFLIDNEHERGTMVEEFKLLSIHICKEYYSSKIEDDPLKAGCLYKRLLPEVFNIWREVATHNSRDTTASVELIRHMHVYLRNKANSTFENTTLFIYPIRGDIHLRSKNVLKGLNHIRSHREMIALNQMHNNSEDRSVKGQTLQQLIHNASLDDRLICFWFRW